MKGITFPSLMDASLPIQKTGEGEWQAELVGEAFEWKELKVGMGKNQKSFTP